jgi:predicted RNase H-like nuclease (RuvC/YqgF family)
MIDSDTVVEVLARECERLRVAIDADWRSIKEAKRHNWRMEDQQLRVAENQAARDALRRVAAELDLLAAVETSAPATAYEGSRG